jgi:hypothetical protein
MALIEQSIEALDLELSRANPAMVSLSRLSVNPGVLIKSLKLNQTAPQKVQSGIISNVRL